MRATKGSTARLALIALLALALTPTRSLAQEYFFRSVVDQNEGHVGQSLQLRLKFYWEVCCVRAAVISEFDIPDAKITGPDSPVQYQEDVNGVTMGVYEVKYFIIPVNLGVLKIPAITLSAEQITSSNIFNPQADQISDIKISSDPISIRILE